MSFSQREQKRLQRILLKKFSVRTTLHKLRRWKRIYIPAKESNHFADIIEPYLHHSMKYKLQKVRVTP